LARRLRLRTQPIKYVSCRTRSSPRRRNRRSPCQSLPSPKSSSIFFRARCKSDKPIRQLKGQVVFLDATGDKVGDLPVDIDERVAPGKTLKTTTGRGWKINPFTNGEIERIAARDFNSMKTKFEAEALAFEGGEVLRAPETK
jgi:hypothetical protein